MKKKIISLMLILTILLTVCGSSKETTKETTVNDLVNSNIVTEFETGTTKPVDEATIKKYNDIMDYLYASPVVTVSEPYALALSICGYI